MSSKIVLKSFFVTILSPPPYFNIRSILFAKIPGLDLLHGWYFYFTVLTFGIVLTPLFSYHKSKPFF